MAPFLIISTMHYLRHSISVLSIAIFSMAIYANNLQNGFTYDDYETVINNNVIKDTNNISLLFKKNYFTLSSEVTYRPAVTFTYFLDYAVYGLKPWGYHLTNNILHTANGILLYIFLTLLAKKSEFKIGTLLVSFLFVSHPVLTEAVNAISFREDLLSFLFYIATLILYIFLRKESNRFQPPLSFLLYIGSCLLYCLALFSKEMAASLPLIVYCYERLYSHRKTDKFTLCLNWYNSGYIAVTLAYLYLRFYYFYNPVEANLQFPILAERLLTIPWLILNYLKLTLFPVLLTADYKIGTVHSLYSIDFFLPFAIVLSLIILVFMTRYREVAFGVFFYLMALIPVYNIIPIANPFAERYLYLPIAGFIIAAGGIINMTLRIWRPYVLFLFVMIVSVYSMSSVKRNGIWMDDYLLWSDTVKKSPNSSTAHNNLGLVYYRQGRLKEAIEEIKKAIRLNPDIAEQYYALAQVYEKEGLLLDAENYYKMAIALKSDDERYRTSIALLYLRQKRFDKSVQELETAYRLNPNEPRIYNNLKLVYEALRANELRTEDARNK